MCQLFNYGKHIYWKNSIPNAYLVRGWLIFLKSGYNHFIIESISKYNKNVILLSQVVKVNSATIKAEKILAITNTTIVNYETAEFLENKLKRL